MVVLMFEVLKAGAGLELNFLKTTLIPLCESFNLDQFRRIINFVAPAFKDCKVARFAKHLGILVGPGAIEDQWTATLKKYHTRVCEVGMCAGGWCTQAYLYRLVALSVLQYKMQFAAMPVGTGRLENASLARVFRAPNNALPGFLLSQLGCLGSKVSISSIQLLARATMCRAWLKSGVTATIDEMDTNRATLCGAQSQVEG